VTPDAERIQRLILVRERKPMRHDGSKAEWLSVLLELRRRGEGRKDGKGLLPRLRRV
jgi:hypothetical protein